MLSAFDLFCWRILIWSIGLSTPLMAALKPRRFIVGEIDFVEKSVGYSHSITLWLYVFFLILAAFIAANHFNNKADRIERQKVKTFWFLTILMAFLPTFSTMIVGGTIVWGSIFCVVAIYSATYFLPAPTLEWWVREVRLMLFIVFVYGSLVVAIIFPNWAWNMEYTIESSVAVFPIRLFGTANHANSLAPLACFAWLLGKFPKCKLRGEHIHSCAIILVVLFSQSKTIWAIIVFLLCILIFLKIRSWGTIRKYFTYITFSVTFFLCAVYLVAYSSYSSTIANMLSDPKVLTLTGRLPIWLFAVEMWLEQPWLGQGLDAWSSQAMLDYVSLLGWAAPHAHNQLLQILSQTGLLGLAVSLIWIRYYVSIIHESPQDLRVMLWWFSGIFFLPGFTEVIFQYGIGTGNAVLTWVNFAVVLNVCKTKMVQN